MNDSVARNSPARLNPNLWHIRILGLDAGDWSMLVLGLASAAALLFNLL